MSERDFGEFELSLVRDDLPYRLQRRVGLIPEGGFGIVRRAIFFTLLTWLPLVLWAWFKGRALPGQVAEPLLQHFGIHARFLVAVPLFILGEGTLHALLGRLLPYFVTSGLVPAEGVGRFREIIHGVIQLRNLTRPWLVIAILVAAQAFLDPPSMIAHELNWANEGAPGTFKLGFAGWWFHFVSRPVFSVLAAGWLWRLVLLTVLLKRIAGLNLALVPTHPDKTGGLGFLEKLTGAFSLFAFAISAVVASRLAHEVLYHGAHVNELKGVLAVFVAFIVLLCLAPLLVFAGPLTAAKRQALLDYGALVGRHGRLVKRRWIDGAEITDDAVLGAPELGPVADTQALYEAVSNMRAAPVGKAAILAIAVPLLIPLLLLFSIEVPVKDLLVQVLSLLI
jgi:hypothetical protein